MGSGSRSEWSVRQAQDEEWGRTQDQNGVCVMLRMRNGIGLRTGTWLNLNISISDGPEPALSTKFLILSLTKVVEFARYSVHASSAG